MIDTKSDRFSSYLVEIIQNEKIENLTDLNMDIHTRLIKIGYIKALENVYNDYMDELSRRITFNLN